MKQRYITNNIQVSEVQEKSTRKKEQDKIEMFQKKNRIDYTGYIFNIPNIIHVQCTKKRQLHSHLAVIENK